jgi:ABC-2 type transport system ATP-binding protein
VQDAIAIALSRDLPCGGGAQRQGRLAPVQFPRRGRDAGKQRIGNKFEQLLAVPYVAVQRGRLDTAPVRKRPHRQRIEAVLLDQFERSRCQRDAVHVGSDRLLIDLSFRVERGTVFALLGPNGAGKSTAVKILTTMTHPDAGRARVAGIDAIANPHGVRRIIGCVAQKDAVDLEATGRENVTLQGQLYGMGSGEVKRRVSELLDRFQLSDAADRIARTYSGGMRRKLGVAMGLAHRPEVLFLDEPTTGLDPEARSSLWAEIRRLATDDGVSVLLTTNYLDEADRLAHRLAIVDEGRVVAEGTPDQLKSRLRGDAINIQLDVDALLDDALRALSTQNGRLRDLTSVGRAVHARVDDGARAVPGVLAALDAAGVSVAAVTVSRPSLDDVYLSHTGRTFSSAHAGDSR